jgi:hypothetical protein
LSEKCQINKVELPKHRIRRRRDWCLKGRDSEWRLLWLEGREGEWRLLWLEGREGEWRLKWLLRGGPKRETGISTMV